MRIYQRILLVAALTLGMIAAGVAWERFYVSPLVEQAQRKSAAPNSVVAEVPAECLEELSAMAPPATAMDSTSGRPKRWMNTARAESSATMSDGATRAGNGPNQTSIRIQVADASAATDHGAAERPIQRVQSAEWLESAADSPGRKHSPARTLPASAEDPLPRADLGAGLKSVDVLDLMHRLRADDGEQRTEARGELMRRGFSEVDLELARQLFSPDAEARKQLAQAVPRLSSVDAAQWLMWLAADPQREVRLAAFTTLATTGDPGLLDRVEALARKDSDPQIQALAEQIAKQRDLAAKRGDAEYK